MFTQLQAHFLCSKLLVIQTHNSTKWRVYHFTFRIYWLGNRGSFVICHHKCSKDILSLSILKICNSKFTALSWNLQSLCICDSCTFRRKSKINWKFSSIPWVNPVNSFLPKVRKVPFMLCLPFLNRGGLWVWKRALRFLPPEIVTFCRKN